MAVRWCAPAQRAVRPGVATCVAGCSIDGSGPEPTGPIPGGPGGELGAAKTTPSSLLAMRPKPGLRTCSGTPRLVRTCSRVSSAA
eukprot:scaffold101263_cov66-Phaeocystis_antarctica.AAC.2